MKEFVVDLLEKNIPVTYTYHNFHHTLYVHEKALEIGRHLNCTNDQLRLLEAAALFHDTGFIKTYVGHEEQSCNIAREYLPDFGFSTADIESITPMIMATKTPQSPKNLLESIIVDADMEYLAQPDATEKADYLFQELCSLHPGYTRAEWNKTQIDFIGHFHYFTDFGKTHKEAAKQLYLDNLLAHNQ